MTELKLNEAFRILRSRYGITDMHVGLPELEVVEGPADLYAIYSLHKTLRNPRRDFYFCADADSNVLGGLETFEQKLTLLPARRQKASA
jgi:hypothetical protein